MIESSGLEFSSIDTKLVPDAMIFVNRLTGMISVRTLHFELEILVYFLVYIKKWILNVQIRFR